MSWHAFLKDLQEKKKNGCKLKHFHNYIIYYGYLISGVVGIKVILQHKQKILTSLESMQCLALPELVLDLVSVLLVF